MHVRKEGREEGRKEEAGSTQEQVEDTQPINLNLIQSFVILICSFVERGIQTIVARSGRVFSTPARTTFTTFDLNTGETCDYPLVID